MTSGGKRHYIILPNGRELKFYTIESEGQNLAFENGPSDGYANLPERYYYIDKVTDNKRKELIRQEYYFALYEKLHGLKAATV